MHIGVPSETKVHEYRVGLTPGAVRELTETGHAVSVQAGAGLGIGFDDEAYQRAGASILDDAESVFAAAELIVKVKEPSAAECDLMRAEHTLFTYLHLAADAKLTARLQEIGLTAIAYETVTARDDSLPLLTPMSEVAGRMSVQVGALCLQKAQGGAGVLLGGVPGVAPGRVTIIGGGVAGSNAAWMAVGLHAEVTVLDLAPARLRAMDQAFGGRVHTLHATRDAIEAAVAESDLVIGAVLIPGATAPRLVDRNLLRQMRPGSALVDISIDQGGCFETSRPTTHADPTFVEEGIVHYCVTNMPGAVARTSTLALNAVTLPFVRALADKGIRKAMAADPHLAAGLNVDAGRISHPAVAQAMQRSPRSST
ncbi:MAG: alanine dehydrogenase [Gammaproteobacteria bacterium]|nr:alanine dehydrogenase [Gammaproteobacteria bacterium]